MKKAVEKKPIFTDLLSGVKAGSYEAGKLTLIFQNKVRGEFFKRNSYRASFERLASEVAGEEVQVEVVADD